MSKWSDKWDKHKGELGNHIIKATNKKRFFSCITKAERGYGKSMYNVQSMAYARYHTNGKDEDEAWQFALDNILFLPSELEERIDNYLETKKRDLVWCLDDASVHFSNKLWFTDQGEAILLENTFDTIRPAVGSLLINCPKKRRLISALQDYDDYEATIYIAEGGVFDRKVTCIHWWSLPSGKQKFRKDYDETFNCIVPDWVHIKYENLRINYLKIIRKKQKEYRDRQRKEIQKN